MQSRFTSFNVLTYLLLLTLLVAAVFGNTIGHGFVWDDQIFVTYKESYRNFDVTNFIFSLKTNDLEYLPVRDLTYAIDFALWGKSAAGFHFSNVVWYWLNVIAVYILSTKITELFREKSGTGYLAEHSRIAGFLVATLFAVHPIHVESVNFITCRNVLVSGTFFFFSCYCYLQYLTLISPTKKIIFYGITLVLFILSLLAKATAIMLPGVLLLFTCYFGFSQHRQRWLALLPFYLLSGAGFFLFRTVAYKTHLMPEIPFSFSVAYLSGKAAIAIQIPLFYLYKLCIPLRYTVDYDMNQLGVLMSDPRPIGVFVFLVAIWALAWYFRLRNPYPVYCLYFYLITLIPVLHIFPTVPVIADRYAFIPSFSFVLFVSFTIVTLMEKRRTWLYGLWFLIIVCLSVLSIKQSQTWKNDTTLWEYTLNENPRSILALDILARLYFQNKDYVNALDFARKANEIDKNNFEYDRLRGELFLKKLRPDAAVIMFESALAKKRDSVEIMISIGRAYELLGDRQMAKSYYQNAINSQEVYLPGNMREKAELLLRLLDHTNNL